MADEVKVLGLEGMREALAAIPAKLRRRALANALRKAARPVRDAAKAGAPVLFVPTRYRSSGTVRRAISVRTSKIARREGDVGVFVNVRPAKQGQRGAKSPKDPFYWRFLEFGTQKQRAFAFLRNAATRLTESLRIFEREVGAQVEKLNVNPKDPL